MATNHYSFEEIYCPICEPGHSEYRLLAKKERYGLPVNTVICKNCGLLMSNPMMSHESLNKFYSDDYRELYHGLKKVPPPEYFSEEYECGKNIVNFLNLSVQDMLVIEVGCGAGGILAAFKEKGAITLGFDLGIDYLEYSIEKYGLNLQHGSIQNYTGKQPDLLIYSDVLEHTRLPDELYNIKRICGEKTLLYIGVPGLLNIHKSYKDFMLFIHIAHLYHFSLGTLANLLQKYGFSMLYGNEKIQSLFILNNQNDQITNNRVNHYKKNIRYLEILERLRLFYKIRDFFISLQHKNTWRSMTKRILRKLKSIYHKYIQEIK
jgi:SAM-dependent methyltransferase